jgi:hypothetical protein
MPSFKRKRSGSVRMSLDAREAALVRELLKEMKTLLEADIPRQDAVVSRLFPDAYDDPEEAEAYRQLVGDELHKGKTAALQRVEALAGTTGRVDEDLTGEDVEAWLTVLNDIRLAIGTRLSVDEDRMGSDIDPDDPDGPALSVVHWLGWMQELMLEQIGV